MFPPFKIECREKSGRKQPWSQWEVCEGSEGLTYSEAASLVKRWALDDKDMPWLRIEYRITAV